MRSWYLSRLALERRFEPHADLQWGVHDRRPSLMMFYARIMSGCVAFCAFVFTLSALAVHRASPEDFAPLIGNHTASPAVSQNLHYRYQNSRDISSAPVALNGTRVMATDGTEMVFQRPLGKLLGTVLMLHGCSHYAGDFFPRNGLCQECLGLPEELKMTRTALERGYSVIALSSTNRRSKCWQTHPMAAEGADYDRVTTALIEAKTRNAYSPEFPLFAVGISSGGTFASSLPLRFKVAGVYSIVSTAVCMLWKSDKKPASSLPAHVFTHMGDRDKRVAERVHKAMQKLGGLGTQSIEFNISPKPVTEHFLADAMPRWGPNLTKRVIVSLQRGGYLDSDFYLLSNPRASFWRTSVQHLQDELEDSLIADESPLSELLNIAWAGHEITAEYFPNALDFLEEKSRGR